MKENTCKQDWDTVGFLKSSDERLIRIPGTGLDQYVFDFLWKCRDRNYSSLVIFPDFSNILWNPDRSMVLATNGRHAAYYKVDGRMKALLGPEPLQLYRFNHEAYGAAPWTLRDGLFLNWDLPDGDDFDPVYRAKDQDYAFWVAECAYISAKVGVPYNPNDFRQVEKFQPFDTYRIPDDKSKPLVLYNRHQPLPLRYMVIGLSQEVVGKHETR